MSLPVTEQQRPIGLISRNLFMSQMSKPYYQEVYGKKSCIAFMDKHPLIVDAAMSIEALAFRAVESGEKALADGFIITRDGALAGIGFDLQLMNVVATMQAERNRQIMHSIDYASVIQRALLRPSATRDPAALMGAVNRGIKTMLGQLAHDGAAPASNDGMDAAFLWYDAAARQLHYCGARLALYLLAPDQPAVQVIEGGRMGVGYVDTPLDQT